MATELRERHEVRVVYVGMVWRSVGIDSEQRVSEIRREVFGARHPATRSVRVMGLADPAMLIEIDAVAAIKEREGPAGTDRRAASPVSGLRTCALPRRPTRLAR